MITMPLWAFWVLVGSLLISTLMNIAVVVVFILLMPRAVMQVFENGDLEQ